MKNKELINKLKKYPKDFDVKLDLDHTLDPEKIIFEIKVQDRLIKVIQGNCGL